MKILNDILIKKLYGFALLYGFIAYSDSFVMNENVAILLVFTGLISVLAYWILMPVAFKSGFTMHSFGHFFAFEFAFFFPLRNVQLEGMAAMADYIIFAFFALVVLIGMIVLAIAGSIRKTRQKWGQWGC
jgi:hypothetical protein